jgi:hypothetical protein
MIGQVLFLILMGVTILISAWKQGEPITFQGLKPWGSESINELTDSEGKKPQQNKHAEGQNKKLVPFKQHFHSGELFLRLRWPDNLEEESKYTGFHQTSNRLNKPIFLSRKSTFKNDHFRWWSHKCHKAEEHDQAQSGLDALGSRFLYLFSRLGLDSGYKFVFETFPIIIAF